MDDEGPDARRVAVIGGGITGLSAALRILDLAPDVRVTLFESGERLGGVIQTERRDGFTLEHGPDSILRRLPWGVDLCQRVGIDGQMVGTQPVARGVYTVYRGRTVRMPDGLAIMAPERIGPVLATRLLSWPGKLRLAAERVLPRRVDGQDESLADFARRRFGVEAYERIVQPLAGGVFMGDPERLSLAACFPQFAEMEAKHGSLIKGTRLARRESRANTNGAPPSVFVAPREGLGVLIDALAAMLGDRVRLRQRVIEITPESDAWRLTIEDAPSSQRKRDVFSGVVLATPAAAATTILRETDPQISRLLGEVEYSSCAIVLLGYPTTQLNHPLDAAGVVVPNVEERQLQACSFSSVKYAGRAPDGSALLRAFFGGAFHPELTDRDDHELIELAKREAADLLGAHGEPTLAAVTRWPRSMPQYHVGHLERVAQIEQLAARHNGLELAGAAFRGVGIPHCIRSGERAAERLVASLTT